MKKEPERLRSTNHSPSPATETKDDDNSNFSTQSNYKKVSNFLKESNKKAAKEQQQQQREEKKIVECNCWVCKILDSSVTEADTLKYEGYNIVSETGDSIFYDPLISSIFNNQEGEDKPRVGQIYIAEDRILDFVQDELLAKHINGVNLNKNEY